VTISTKASSSPAENRRVNSASLAAKLVAIALRATAVDGVWAIEDPRWVVDEFATTGPDGGPGPGKMKWGLYPHSLRCELRADGRLESLRFNLLTLPHFEHGRQLRALEPPRSYLSQGLAPKGLLLLPPASWQHRCFQDDLCFPKSNKRDGVSRLATHAHSRSSQKILRDTAPVRGAKIRGSWIRVLSIVDVPWI
jgi:hypothetical protein